MQISLSIVITKSLVGLTGITLSCGSSVSSYSHTISANGGYDTATFSLAGSLETMEYWLQSGIGSHIEIYNMYLTKVWEGFIDEVVITYGQSSVSSGKISEIANRVSVDYQDFVTGEQDITATANDLASQNRYGVLQKVYSGGKVSQTNAEKIRDEVLSENKMPHVTNSLAGFGVPQITVNCLGYIHFLDLFTYSQEGASWTLREKILDVLGKEPNSVFSLDRSRISSNTLSVPKDDLDGRTGRDVLSDLAALGGDSDNYRRIYGCLNDRLVYYRQVPSTIKYYKYITANQVGFRLTDGNMVLPSDVKAGEWVFVPDMLAGAAVKSNIRDDSRAIFIEQVSYTAPIDLSITGSYVGTVAQRIKKLGGG